MYLVLTAFKGGKFWKRKDKWEGEKRGEFYLYRVYVKHKAIVAFLDSIYQPNP